MAEVHYLETGQGRLAYDDSGGEGALVICLPGMGDLREEYRYLAPQLQAAGLRVVSVDLRGHGQSSVPWPDYHTSAIGADVLALIDHLHATQAVVIGDSFAAGAAVWAACQRPQQIRALVMIAPVVRNLPQPWYKRAIANIGFGGPWRVAFWMFYWRHLFASRTPPDQLAYTLRLHANMSEAGRFDAALAMIDESRNDIDELLGHVQQPALVLMGSGDIDFARPRAEGEYVARKTHAQLAMIAGAGHYPHVEMPGVAGPRIVEFLREIEGIQPLVSSHISFGMEKHAA